MSDQGEIRAGVIGLGSFFENVHLRCMRRVKGLRIVAAADLDEGRRQRGRDLLGGDVVIHADHRAMLAGGGLDAVYVITKPQAMPAIVPDVAAAGLPVFCEKPPGMSSADTERLAEVCEAAGIAQQVAFNRRFGPFTRQVRQWLAAAGAPTRVEVAFHRVFSSSAAHLTGNGIHGIDMILSLVGPARRVMACRAAPRGEAFGAFTAAIEFAGGAIGTFIYDNRMQVPAEQYQIQIVSADTLTVERISLHFPPPTKVRPPCVARRLKMVYRDWVDGESQWDEQREELARPDFTGDDDLLIGGGYQDEHDTFAGNLLAGEPIGPTFRETVHSMQVAEAIQAGACRDF